MGLHLDVVCTDFRVSAQQRQQQTLRVIGEILPLVLAKYGVAPLAVPATKVHKQAGPVSRFQIR